MAFRHCVLGKSWLWLFLLGPAPFAFCFVSLLDGEAHIWLGDLRFALCGLGLLFLLCCDLLTYMTTGVHVDVILTCFFSCKDRASERYRPRQRKKKDQTPLPIWRPEAYFKYPDGGDLETEEILRLLELFRSCLLGKRAVQGVVKRTKDNIHEFQKDTYQLGILTLNLDHINRVPYIGGCSKFPKWIRTDINHRALPHLVLQCGPYCVFMWSFRRIRRNCRTSWNCQGVRYDWYGSPPCHPIAISGHLYPRRSRCRHIYWTFGAPPDWDR